MAMIKVIAGGKKHAKWLAEACEEYEKRLKKPFVMEWFFVDEEKIPERIARLNTDDYVVLLDENGKMFDSIEFSKLIVEPLETGRNVVIVIGGAFGHFSPEIIQRANAVWSLSKLVFPHQLCRLLVTEQIYRAQEIVFGHKYHHE